MRFTKMHGLGNDFMVLDGVNQPIQLSKEQIKQLSRRDTGIGFDQCLLVEKSTEPKIDFFYRIFNANGEEVGQCGNGARCLALFIRHYGLSDKSTIRVKTCTTAMELLINADNTVTVNMGIPRLEPSAIPLLASEKQASYYLDLGDSSQEIHALSLGNPHAVSLSDDLSAIAMDKIGKQISEHRQFPEQANAGFMQILNPSHLKLRVYERGCGETQACGSAAVAAAAVGRLYYQMEAHIRVSLLGGDLWIDWPDVMGDIFLSGPASFVYEGRLFE